MKLVASILTVFIVWPMSFFLYFQMMKLVGATELMWFVFWAYVPVALICGLLVAIAGALDDGK